MRLVSRFILRFFLVCSAKGWSHYLQSTKERGGVYGGWAGRVGGSGCGGGWPAAGAAAAVEGQRKSAPFAAAFAAARRDPPVSRMGRQARPWQFSEKSSNQKNLN